jgi:hypothetical protein
MGQMAVTPSSVKALFTEIERAVNRAIPGDYLYTPANNPIQIDVTCSQGAHFLVANVLPDYACCIKRQELLDWQFNSTLSIPEAPNKLYAKEPQELFWLLEDVLLCICRNTGHGAVILSRKNGNLRKTSQEFKLVWYYSSVTYICLT